MLKKLLKSLGMGKSAAPKLPRPDKPVGEVTHFFGDIKVATITFKQAVPVGASITIQGATTDFTQSIESMQYDHKSITAAIKNKEVGIKVKDRVRVGDLVYLNQ